MKKLAMLFLLASSISFAQSRFGGVPMMWSGQPMTWNGQVMIWGAPVLQSNHVFTYIGIVLTVLRTAVG